MPYFGVVELERAPYLMGVNIIADTVEQAKSAYEAYCNKVGGYIVNLYPMSNPKNREQYRAVADISETVYA